MGQVQSFNEKNLSNRLVKAEGEILQLKTKQEYLVSDIATYKNGPLHLTAWATPDYMSAVWGGWYSVSCIFNFEGILPQKTCFGFADHNSYGAQNMRIYTCYVSGTGKPNTLQVMLQIVGYGQFESDIYFWANSPGVVKLVEQFVFETDEW